MKTMIRFLGAEYEINLEQLTQLGGCNIREKNKIISAMEKYFSTSKYTDFEDKFTNSVTIDGNVIGRKYYLCYSIENKKDLLTSIKISKNSLFSIYLTQLFSDFDFQDEFIRIDDILTGVIENINDKIRDKIGAVFMKYQLENYWSLLQKADVLSEETDFIESLTEYKLIILYLNLLTEIQRQNPEKRMVIFKNIDHILSKDEYSTLVCKCKELSDEMDMWFVFSSSIDGYIVINEEITEGINIINDTIFSFPAINYLQDYIENNYPVYKSIAEKELIDILEKIAQQIGKHSINQQEELVVKKLLNKSLMIEDCWTNSFGNCELSFLSNSNMV